MSSRFVLGLVCLTALASCRDLVQSGDPPALEHIAEGLLLDPEGTPLVGAQIRLDNDRYRRLGPRVSWDGNTDEFGRFYPELRGDGPYDVRALPDDTLGLPREFRFLRLLFPEDDTLVLRLPMERFTGQLSWSEGEPLPRSAIQLQFRYEEDGWIHGLELHPTAAGALDGWLTPGQIYTVNATSAFGDNYLNFDWPDPLELNSGDGLDLTIPVVGFDLTTTLGGMPAVATGMRVDVEGLVTHGRLAAEHVTGQSSLRAYGFAEVAAVEISPLNAAPFLRRKFFVDLSAPAATLTAELGRFRLSIHVIDGDGLPWAGAWVRIRDQAGRDQTLNTNVEGVVQIFLEAGSYLVGVGPEQQFGDYDVSVAVPVVGDREVTVTLE